MLSIVLLFFRSPKVNKALTLDRTKRQWVDLGIHTEVCMARPDTCGSAIGIWMKLIGCPNTGGGIISTSPGGSSGSVIYCCSAGMGYDTWGDSNSYLSC